MGKFSEFLNESSNKPEPYSGFNKEVLYKTLDIITNHSDEIIASAKSGPWEVSVSRHSINSGSIRRFPYLVYNHNFSEKPAFSGFWMNFYDKDYMEVHHMSKAKYDMLSDEERAKLDAEIQIKKYIEDEFYNKYMETYNNVMWDKLWDKLKDHAAINKEAKKLYDNGLER